MEKPVILRPAILDDVPALVELHIRSWQWAYQGLISESYLAGMSETLARRIERRHYELAHLPAENRWWVAEQVGRVVGFAMTGPSHDDDAPTTTAEVYAIYLLSDAAGKGIGRALFAHAVADFRQRRYEQATLWVLASNRRARSFYEAAGWTPDGASKVDQRPDLILHEVRYRITLRSPLSADSPTGAEPL